MDIKTSEAFFAEMLAAIRELSGLAISEGSEPALRLMALAAQLETLCYEARWIYRQSFPQTSDGGALDLHAELRGLTRRPASRAEGVIRFYTDGGTAVTVPAGTVCLTGGQERFETTKELVIAKGEVSGDAPAVAVEAGVKGNIMPGAVCAMSPAPMGVTGCANPAVFTGGSEAEDDESLRKRVVSSYRTLPNGANAAYYETEAMAVAGVAAARAIARPRGIGTVDVCVASPSGTPSDELLQSVRTALAPKREIAVDLGVIPPRTVTVNIAAQLELEAGYDFTAVSAEARSALAAYFTGALLATPVYAAKLMRLLLDVEGVVNIRLTAPAGDIAAANDLLPVLGSVALTQM